MQPDRPYTIALSKGAALVDETRALVEHWDPNESVDDFARRVLQANLLARSTAYRTKDIVRRVFAPRFLQPTDRGARNLKQIAANRLERRLFNEALFIYAARADRLLHDFTTQVFWPACWRGRSVLNTDDVVSFLCEAWERGRMEQSWSREVQVKIARGVLSTLRDVGLLREVRRGQREIVSYRISDSGVAFLAHDLHEAGFSDVGVSDHPDWGLFGLDRRRLLDRLDLLSGDHGTVPQWAGDTVRITWNFGSTEELLNELA
jgi:hypothetical protein